MSEERGRSGFAAIVGRPNVGKSTLLNRVLGEKLAIVSRRPQTTRNRILGIKNLDDNQVVLIDTPGIHRSRANLNRFMVREALESLDGVDCVLLMTEVLRRRPGEEGQLHEDDRYVLEQIRIQQTRAPIIVVINKIDLIDDKGLLLPMIAAWQQRGFSAVVPISALRSDGVDRLLEEVVATLPQGPPLYPEEMLTDRAERFLAEELIREQVFRRCRQDLPHSAAVSIQEFNERPQRGDVTIEAVIHVERASQKAIVIGKQGRMIQAIGSAARRQIGRLLGCEVHLKTTVRVEPDWSKRPAGRRKLGYE
jgi:GTP-binding protein Era